MFPQHIDIMFAQHNLRNVAFLLYNLGYVFTLRDEMRTDFLRWEIHYAKYVKNVSELRDIMRYAMACVNLTGLFSWVYDLENWNFYIAFYQSFLFKFEDDLISIKLNWVMSELMFRHYNEN